VVNLQVSYDLVTWLTPASSADGSVIVTNDSTQFTVQLRRSTTPRAFFRIVAYP
jgi:hypothetical protein